MGRDVLRHLWDNYIQISPAQRVILIGHGTGCQMLMGLIDKRAASVMKKVKLVVQVVGHSKVPMVPKYSDELRNWYGQQNVSRTQAQAGDDAD
jgi:histone deacetylase 6